MAKKRFNVFYFIHAIIVNRVSVGHKLAALVPVANRQGGNPEEGGDFFYSEEFFRHGNSDEKLEKSGRPRETFSAELL